MKKILRLKPQDDMQFCHSEERSDEESYWRKINGQIIESRELV